MSEQIVHVVTHDGVHHADEVLALATLVLAHTPEVRVQITRTRHATAVLTADVIVDVGGEYAPERGRFDHHQPGGSGLVHPPADADDVEVPLASFGLVWREYGLRAVRNLLTSDVAEERVWPGAEVGIGAVDLFAPNALPAFPRRLLVGLDVERVTERLRSTVVREVDARDCGVRLRGGGGGGGISEMIASFNRPWWDEGAHAERQGFVDAFHFAQKWLASKIQAAAAHVASEALVVDAPTPPWSPEVLWLEKYVPWQVHVQSRGDYAALKYVIFPGTGGDWMIQAVPTDPGGTVSRLPLPAAWRGQPGPRLQEVTGVPGAVFCHPAGFIAGAASKEAIRDMAMLALTQDRG